MRVRVRVRVTAGRAPPQLSGGQLGDGGGEEDGQRRLEAEGRDRVVLEAREREEKAHSRCSVRRRDGAHLLRRALMAEQGVIPADLSAE